MKTNRNSSGNSRGIPFIESLEDRRLFAVVAPTRAALRAPARSTFLTASTVIVSGTSIHAEAAQEFTAVIGTISGLKSVPTGYTLQGEIDWGDGTVRSAAKFVRQADGSIAVIGTHTYDNVGIYQISAEVEEVPPPWSEAPVFLLGTIQSKADVIASQGGVTLEETAGAPFTAGVGFFQSRLPVGELIAAISWGDGHISFGKIIALPTADPIGGRFEVVGDHSYDQTGSYLVQVWVLNSPPAGPAAGGLTALITSVINVLPPSPTAT